MILFLMVGLLVGLATGDVNMSPVVLLDHFGFPGGSREVLFGLFSKNRENPGF